MDLPNANNILKSFDIFNQTSSYPKLIRNIKQVDQQLMPSFLLPTYKNYNPSYIHRSLLFYTIALTGHSDQLVKEAALHLTNHFAYLMASVTPIEFIHSIQEMLQNKHIDSKLIANFLPPIGHALSLLSEEDTIHSFSFIQQLFNVIPEAEHIRVPITLWKALGSFAPENEVMKILQKNLDIKLASIAPHLIRKAHRKYSHFLFTTASTDYLIEFFTTCPAGFDLDFDTIIYRISDACQKVGSIGFNSTILLLSKVIRYQLRSFTEEQEAKLKEIISTLETFLNDPKILPSDIGVIILVLFESSKKELLSTSDLKNILNTITDRSRDVLIPYLRASILCIDSQSDNSDVFAFLKTFHPWDKDTYITYIYAIKESYSLIKTVDKDAADAILFSLFHPLPLDIDIAVAIVNFLLVVDPADILNPAIDSQLDNLFHTYFSFKSNKLGRALVSLAQFYRYYPPIHTIDFFSDNAHYWLSTLGNVDFMILKEILEAKLLKPRHRYAVFQIFQSNPLYYTGFSRHLADVLFLIVCVLGISSDVNHTFTNSLTLNMHPHETYFTLDELQEMMADIQGPLDRSDFGILLSTTLKTISHLMIPQGNFQKKFIARTAVLAGFLTPLCPKYSLSLLYHLDRLPQATNNDNTIEFKFLRRAFEDAYALVKKTPIPMKYSVDVAMYGKYCLGGYEGAIKEYPEYVKHAISTTRQAADLFKDEIQDPLPPMPTFLSFVGIPKYEELVNICVNIINPFEWKLKRGDKEAILACTKDNEEIQKLILSYFNSYILAPKQPNRIYVNFKELAPTFAFNKNLVIKEGPKVHLKDKLEALPTSIANLDNNEMNQNTDNGKDSTDHHQEEDENTNHEEDGENEAKRSTHESIDEMQNGEKGTLFGLISFLWHSTLPLPDSIKPKELENYAIDHSDSVQMLIGFFSWANVNHYQIEIERWSDAIKLHKFTDQWLFAISLFASNIRCPFDSLSPKTLFIFQQCLNSFTFMSMTKENLKHAYQTHTGLQWYLIYNILCIDPKYFSDYPAIVAEITQDLNLFKIYLDKLKDPNTVNYDAFIAINNIVFKPSNKDMINTRLLPTNRHFETEIMSFKEISRIPSQLELPTDLLESVITTLRKIKYVSYSFLEFFMNVKITKEQFNRVYALFFNDRDETDLAMKFKLPSLFLTGNDGMLAQDAIRFYSNKPPSLTRAFFRSLLCCFAPPLNQAVIKEVHNSLLEPVFPDLCYTGFSKMGIHMWDSATAYSKLRFRFLDTQIGSTLLNDLKIPCQEALYIYPSLMALNNDDLAVAQPWATKGMIRNEISQIFLETATSESSNADFAIQACQELVAAIGADNLMVLIGNKGFFSKPNFLCTVVVFLELLHLAKKSGKNEVVDFLTMLMDPETNFIEDEQRAEIFSHIDKDVNISRLLHQ